MAQTFSCTSSGAFARPVIVACVAIVLQSLALSAQTERPAGKAADGEMAPVVVVEISERWISALADETFVRKTPVSVAVLGVCARGTATTKGKYTVRCVPVERGLGFDLRIRGTSLALTRAIQGPAVVHTRSVTAFEASKCLELHSDEIQAGRTSVDATSLKRTSSVDSTINLGERLVRRIAHERIRRNEAIIDAIAEREAERRIVSAVDEAVEQFRQRVNRRLAQLRRRYPWLGWGEMATLIRMETSDHALRFSYRDFGGSMDNPAVLAVGVTAWGLRVWLDEPRWQLASILLRRWAARAEEIASHAMPTLPWKGANWSLQRLRSPDAVRLHVPSARIIVRIPTDEEPLLVLPNPVGAWPASWVPKWIWRSGATSSGKKTGSHQ